MRKVVFDIETIGTLNDFNVDNMELTMACIWDSETNEYSSFLKEDLPKLWPILERADSIIGYNSDHFDIPILNKYYAGDLTKLKSIDLLKEVKNILGRRLKLDNLAEATLGKKKSGNGMDAQQWWKNGEIEKIRTYCIDDVRITKELYEYALENKSLKYRDFDGVREVKLDPSGWESSGEGPGMTHTLPF